MMCRLKIISVDDVMSSDSHNVNAVISSQAHCVNVVSPETNTNSVNDVSSETH